MGERRAASPSARSEKDGMTMTPKLRNMTSVYFVEGETLLCLYRVGSRVANNKYIGSAGGHFEKEELNDPKACILREIREELGLSEEDVKELSLRYITHRLAGGEIRQNYYFFGKLKDNRPLNSTEGQLHWVPFGEVPDLDMPVSAKHMILHYLKEGRFTDKLYCGATEEAGTRFVEMREF